VHELVKLPLGIQIVLGLKHELSDIVLEVLREFHVLHRSVRDVDLLLKALRFSVEGLN